MGQKTGKLRAVARQVEPELKAMSELCHSAAASGQPGPAAGAAVRLVMRQESSVRRSYWVMAAAARMAGGAAGSMISSTDRATAWSPDGPGSMTGLRVRCRVAGPSAAQTGPTAARSASRPACRP